eukprot:scaffold84702_cov17-Tisochrysis_lutea.AAC.1
MGLVANNWANQDHTGWDMGCQSCFAKSSTNGPKFYEGSFQAMLATLFQTNSELGLSESFAIQKDRMQRAITACSMTCLHAERTWLLNLVEALTFLACVQQGAQLA